MGAKRILIVEDSPALAEGLRLALTGAGYRVVVADSVSGARERLGESFDLYLLDVTLPDGTGFELCRELRRAYPSHPVLLLTARTDEDSAVRGLSSGASDFLRKPIGKRELVARLRNWLGEAPEAPGKSLRFHQLELDQGTRAAKCAASTVALSKSEFDILWLLMRRGGEVVSREEMLGAVDPDGEALDRAIDSHLSRLRSKFRKAGVGAVHISPAYGVGYRLEWKS